MTTSSDAEIVSKFRDMAMSDRTDMISREVAYIPDQNGSSYNGQINFDLSSLGQSNRWLNYSEAYIQIPYVVGLRGRTADDTANFDISAFINSQSIACKDGFYQMIDSLSVEYNQKQVCQVQNFSNVHTHFKLLTSSSYDDLNKNGPTNGFLTDRVQNYSYNAVATNQGVGYVNNLAADLLNRQSITTAYDVTADATEFPTLEVGDMMRSGTSYFNRTAEATAADRTYYWVIMATIRLSDLTDFFTRIPICKTTDIRLTINYNSSRVVLNASAAAVLTVQSYQQISGHTCPFMIPPLGANPSAACRIVLQSNVGRSGLGEAPVLGIDNCRLYVPIYKLSDNVSLAMIKSYPATKFSYNDIYSYSIPSIAAGSAFVHTLSTGIVNAQYVVCIPYPKTNAIAGVGCAAYQSVFDTCPGTSSNIIIRDFNVQVAGINVFQQNERFDYEQFLDELSKINAINGNNTLGLTSGVLNLEMFKVCYRMYVADLRRREPSQDNVIKSIVVSGTNTAGCEIELLCFVAYQKDMVLDTATGLIME